MKNTERAQQVWQVLIGAAHRRQTITYGQLSELIGMGGNPVVVDPPIDLVWKYCKKSGFPPLTYLVVSEVTGRPSPDFPDLDREREPVFNYPWFEQLPPQVQDFEQP